MRNKLIVGLEGDLETSKKNISTLQEELKAAEDEINNRNEE